jgi:hypothetical protein
VVWLAAAVLLWPGGLATAQPTPGKKYAVLVGVNEYKHEKLQRLHYAENDAFELANVLRAAGYEVTLLTGGEGVKDGAVRPTRANIDNQLRTSWASAAAGTRCWSPCPDTARG